MEINLKVKSRIPATSAKIEYAPTYDEADIEVFDNMGIGMSESAKAMIESKSLPSFSFAFDAAPAMQTTATVATPVQFLQWWSPKVIKTLFAKRMADEIFGITNAGAWEDMEVVVPEIETLGDTSIYADKGNSVEASWNPNFNKRAVVRFMASLTVGELEARQSAKMRINSKEKKMIGVTNALEIQRNQVAFNGFLVGTEANYGILNDPRLLPYNTIAVGASGFTQWSKKDYLEVNNDIRTMLQGLQTQMNGLFDPQTDEATLIVPTSVGQFITITPQFGNSVLSWIKENYPNLKIKYAPQFDKALGGQNVAYLIKDDVDGDKNVEQFIQQKMFLVGFKKEDTYVKETYSNATAGVFVGYGVAAYRIVGC